MADPNKLPIYGIGMYNTRGQYRWCMNDAEVRVAINDGFTSKRYIPSKWPTTIYDKKTGDAKAVGSVDFSDEKNEAELAALLAQGWTKEQVVVAKPSKESETASHGDSRMLGELLAEIRLLGNRIEDLETAVSDISGARASFDSRVTELESIFAEAARPDPVVAGPADKAGKHK